MVYSAALMAEISSAIPIEKEYDVSTVRTASVQEGTIG